MLKCRTLLAHDIQSIKELWLNKASIFKSEPPAEYLQSLSKKVESLFNKPDHRTTVYGVFDSGDNLVATWSVFRWMQLPYYTIEELVIKNEEKSVIKYKKTINTLLEKIFFDMESENRFTFYILAKLRPYQKKALLKSMIWEIPEDLIVFENYQITLEAIIPANSQPTNAYWDMMGKRTWNHDLWIRQGRLKSESLIPRLTAQLL